MFEIRKYLSEKISMSFRSIFFSESNDIDQTNDIDICNDDSSDYIDLLEK